MNTIVYVGMDVHKESFTLCCYCYDTDKVEYKQTIPADYRLILKYMDRIVMKRRIQSGKGWKRDLAELKLDILKNMQ